MIIFTFLGKKYAILCFPSPRGRRYLCLSFCRVGVMMFLPHLIEGEYMCVLRSVEMGAFSEVIATFMKETTHTGKSHTHTHTHTTSPVIGVDIASCRAMEIDRGSGKVWTWRECQVSVQFSHSDVSDSLQPHGLQHARPPCPLPSPGAWLDSCPLSW